MIPSFLLTCSDLANGAQKRSMILSKGRAENCMQSRRNQMSIAGTAQHCTESRKKILEYRWEKLRKKILEDCLWQVTKHELEALEACYWLKATGFQEYVHMYEDQQFPVDIHIALEKHDSLDEDAKQSLIRRLEILNSCDKMLEKGIKTTSPFRSKLSSSSTELGRQCTSSVPSRTQAPKLSSSVSIEAASRKRPSSKHGIYHLQEGSQCLSMDDEVFSADEGNKLLRNLSFSGTSKSMIDQMIGYTSRKSIYDNVHLPIASSSDNICERTDASVFDSGLAVSNGTFPRQFANRMESDDDISLISSPEYDDEYEALVSKNKVPSCDVYSSDVSSGKVASSIDSGVASSPILRSPSVRRCRYRWHSFQQFSERESIPHSLRIENMSAGQLHVLRKISLLRLTALIERYSMQNRSSWHWTIPKLLRRLRTQENKGIKSDKNIFGSTLLAMVQRTGEPLPRPILLSMSFLQRTALKKSGIFRRSGMKSRIENLKREIESGNSKVDFDSYSPYDVADVLKQYLRELPEPLLTSKLAETFISIYKDFPKELREESMQLGIILMPDENREALQTVLAFLRDFADMSNENQMDYKNLSVCFTPAFFHVFGVKCDKTYSSKRQKRAFNSQKSEKDFEDTSAAHQCLEDLMKSLRFLFTVPKDVMMKCEFSYIEQGDPVSLEDLSNYSGETGDSGYRQYVDNCFTGLLQESHAKSKGWIQHGINSNVEISYKTVKDGYPIRLWKAVVDVNAPPVDVLRRFVKERHLWDEEMVHWEYIETLDEETDIFYYETQSIAPSIKRDYLLLRSWRRNLNGKCCGCVSTSITHKAVLTDYGHRVTVLADRCLLEPFGRDRCKITYISRIDLRGKSPKYYNEAVGPWLVYSCVSKIRETFNCGPDGLETKV